MMVENKLIHGEGRRRRKINDGQWESDSEPEVEAEKTNLNSTSKPPTDNQRLTEVAEPPTTNLVDARNESRVAYLKKRQSSKISELEEKIQELEETIKQQGFGSLSNREQTFYRKQTELLRIHREREAVDASGELYQLPEDYITESGKIDRKRKELALNRRYQEEDAEKANYDNDWENEQFRKAQKTLQGFKTPSYATKQIDRLSKRSSDQEHKPEEEEFEYVFDDSQTIKFVSDSVLNGTNTSTSDRRVAQEKNEAKRLKRITMAEVRRSLPVYTFRDQFLKAIKDNQVLVVVGETGSGKTTQLPQYLHEDGYSKNGLKIACTQPRRVAAMSVASRVADEMSVKLGNEVGYSIRFEDKTSERTVIKYMTDGMLLREFINDPELSRYSALMIDEAHERTISTEILMSLLKDVMKVRTDLKVIIASATINSKKFSDFFGQAPVLNIPGRRFPVEILYSPQPEANYEHAAITTILTIHISEGPGDILVFLTGQDEIENMAQNLEEASKRLGNDYKALTVCPIYANMPPELQSKIFDPTPSNARKVVLATNIAETSITIDGITFVIDPGYVKEKRYNPTTGMESLDVVPCSRASADQRSGRAGRVGPGKCFRLYTKWAYFHELPATPDPEILRSNLASIVLSLLSLGIHDLVHFNFMDRPKDRSLIRALNLLYSLGAMEKNGKLSKLGRQMSNFPLDPMLSKTLISSCDFNCLNEVLSIVAMLGESAALFFRPKDKKEQADKVKETFTQPSGDHLTLLEIWNKWTDTGYSSQWCVDNFIQYKTMKRVRNVREQLSSLCESAGLFESKEDESIDSLEAKTANIQQAITSGFFTNTARLSKTGDSYRTLSQNQSVYIHPSSVIYSIKPPPKLVLYHELVQTSKEFMRSCLIVEEKWITKLAPHFKQVNNSESVSYK